MNTKISSLVSLLALSALFAGCALGDSTRGDEGRVDFSYGATCFFGCGTDQPVLSASSERIDVTGPGNDEGVSGISLDPAIAELSVRRSCYCEHHSGNSEASASSLPASGVCDAGFDKLCDNALDLVTHAAGDVKIELHDSSGSLIDSTTLHVRSADRIELTRLQNGTTDETSVSSLALMPGESAELRATAYAGDQKLLGGGGFAWSSSESKVAGFGLQFFADSPVNTVTADQSGTTTLAVTAGGATVELPIDVH
jgi:hypothetical protein